jgi:hypothetical protein
MKLNIFRNGISGESERPSTGPYTLSGTDFSILMIENLKLDPFFLSDSQDNLEKIEVEINEEGNTLKFKKDSSSILLKFGVDSESLEINSIKEIDNKSDFTLELLSEWLVKTGLGRRQILFADAYKDIRNTVTCSLPLLITIILYYME